MDDEICATIPETIEMREIRYNVVGKGMRTETLTVVTTLVDAPLQIGVTSVVFEKRCERYAGERKVSLEN